jgi:hypothetical protein
MYFNNENNTIINENNTIDIVDAESNQNNISFNNETQNNETYIILTPIELIEVLESFEINDNIRFFELPLIDLITFKNLEDSSQTLQNTLRGKIVYNLNVNRIIYNSVVIYMNLHILSLKGIKVNKYILAKRILEDIDIFQTQLNEINLDITINNYLVEVKTNLNNYLLYQFDIKYYDTINIYRDCYISNKVDNVNDLKYLNLLDVETISIENNYLIKELEDDNGV